MYKHLMALKKNRKLTSQLIAAKWQGIVVGMVVGSLFWGSNSTHANNGAAPSLGIPVSQAEINHLSITIFPDGKNLPAGQGTVKDGEVLYQTQCVMCHGEKGIEGPAARLAGSDGWFSIYDPLRILRIRKHPILLISVGSLWPHATSIFDYVRRAMPHYAPKSLSNKQTYALTAYILYLNGLIERDSSLNATNILTIEMPGKLRSSSDQRF